MASLTLRPPNSGYSSAGIQKAFDKCGIYENDPLDYSEIIFSEGTYFINSRMYLNSGTKITCKGNVIFTLAPNLPVSTFGVQVPVIGQKEDSIYGLDLSGICFNGNYKNQSETVRDHGDGYFNIIGLENVADSVFHDFSGGFNEGDYFRIANGTNLEFYNNVGEGNGHDHTHLYDCDYVKVYNNRVKLRIGNALRLRSCHHVDVSNNVSWGTKTAYTAVYQFENIVEGKSSYDIDVHDNIIMDSFGPAVWFLSNVPNTYDLRIHNNLIMRCGTMPVENKISGVGGIIGDGWDKLLIENNTIDGCYGYGIGFTNYRSETSLTGFHATIRKNIITNTKKCRYPGIKSGAAIANLFGSRWDVTAEDNCIYGNLINEPFGVSATGTISDNPLYVDAEKENYHLKSAAGHYTTKGFEKDSVTSPCIFSGYELGRFCGTSEASCYPSAARPGLQIQFSTKEAALLFLSAVKAGGYLIGDEEVTLLNIES